MNENIVKYIQGFEKKNLKVHPVIMAIDSIAEGSHSIKHVYVCIGRIKFKLDSVLEALNCCFQCFFVFQIDFPLASAHIWHLIARSVYQFPQSIRNQNFAAINTVAVMLEQKFRARYSNWHFNLCLIHILPMFKEFEGKNWLKNYSKFLKNLNSVSSQARNSE